jgi:hypothetical protein
MQVMSTRPVRSSPTTGSSPKASARKAELLERDEAVEVGLAREVDHGHPAAADLTHDLVPPDRAGDLHAHAQTVDQ